MALMDVKGYAAALFLLITTCVFLFLLGDPQAFYANSHGDRKLKEEALHFMTEETAGSAEPQYTTSSSSAIYIQLNRESRYYMQGDGNLEVVTRNALQQDENGDEERVFEAHGSAAALFVLYGAYRGGSNTFAAVGLGYKPLYLYGEPEFECYWIPSVSNQTAPISGEPIKSQNAWPMLPDYGYGRVYTTVVVNCTFAEPVGTFDSQRGGQLIIAASHGDGVERPMERFIALTEDENAYNPSMYEPLYKYDYLYCGSPLFGDLNAKRLREWIAYHIRLFGPKSHFVFHDAGGMHEEVRAVLEPWRKLGYVSIQNVKKQAEYDAYYYNQFLINNDCLHRTKFMANWTFFFDVDEYIYIDPELDFPTVMSWYRNVTMLGFNQLRMSDVLCQGESSDAIDPSRPWAFEKLVYGEEFGDMKYAVQARQVFATGVHYSQKELGHMEGDIAWAAWDDMRFYHYHNTINQHYGLQVCREFAGNATFYAYDDGATFTLDTSMLPLGPLVRQFEKEHINVAPYLIHH